MKLSGHNPSLSCVSITSTLEPWRCPNVLMTLSGGTTGLSFKRRDSRRVGDVMWNWREREGFMIKACGERAKK